MPFRPSEPGEFPTLGWYALSFMAELLAAPDRMDYEPFLPTREQAEFALNLWRLDPVTCKRVASRAVLSRSRGWGKSPFIAACIVVECLGDMVPDGWDADGRPVGKPWNTVRTPYGQLVAVSEDQTAYAWDPLLEMLRNEAPVHDQFPGLEPLKTRVNLPGGRGHISPITSSAWTAKGGKPVAVGADQTEVWYRSNGGVKLARVLRNNAAKLGGMMIETPNAFTPGEDSVAETTAKAWEAMQSAGRQSLRIYYDHREWPATTDIDDHDSLEYGLRVAYGDSSAHPDGCVIHDPPCAPGWVDIEDKIETIWEPDADEQVSRSDWGNQVTHASDAYVSSVEWANERIADDSLAVAPRDVIALGFDGSRARHKGKPDATALIGCRLRDGFLFELGVWEAEDRPSAWKNWQPPLLEIQAAVAEAFQKYRVTRFYCDPAKDWRSTVNDWEAKYGSKLFQPEGTKKQVQQQHPFEWWMTGGRSTLVERAVEAFYAAVVNEEVRHAKEWGLTRHMLNARRRVQHGKLVISKESSYSQKKIDAAVAAVLAYQGCLDATAAGVKDVPERAFALPRRVY